VRPNNKIIASGIPLLIFVTLSAMAISLPATATGDSGDSITHYLYSRYALKHTGIFFDHWAKPLFVLVTALPAQLGFKAVAVLNIAFLTGAAWLCHLTARALGMRFPLFVYAGFIFAPLCVKLSVSGLTEYLFALMLSASIYLLARERRHAAAMIISFLPLVRSEGLLVFAICLVMFLSGKHYRSIIFLLSGQFLYSVAGALYFKSVSWVFTEIPYAKLGSPYGHGELTDMLHRLNYVIEKPLLYLLVVSFLFLAWNLRTRELRRQHTILTFVAVLFIAYFVFHSYAWWKGYFNSMGLPRVFIAVMPCIALLCTYALGSIEALFTKWRGAVLWVHVGCVVIFPFSPREKGVVFDAGLFRVEENEIIQSKAITFIEGNIPDYHERVLYATHPYAIMALGADPFDYYRFGRLEILAGPAFLPRDAIVVWDKSYAEQESGISLEKLNHDPRLEPLGVWSKQTRDDEFKVALFVTK
jgi:hypothetical protein